MRCIVTKKNKNEIVQNSFSVISLWTQSGNFWMHLRIREVVKIRLTKLQPFYAFRAKDDGTEIVPRNLAI
jgi:hypothetical protein